MICETSLYAKIPYEKHVNFISKLGYNSIPKRNMEVDVFNLFILMYVDQQRKSHLEVNNILSYLLMILLDYVCICLRTYKYEAFDTFKIFKDLVENKLDLKIKCLITPWHQEKIFFSYGSSKKCGRKKNEYNNSRNGNFRT